MPFQVPALVDAGFRVVTFNPRGIPPSEVPDPPYSVDEMAVDAAELIEQLSDDPVAVIGYSMGALIAQELALSRPDLCRGAALLGTLGRKDVFRRALFEASLDELRAVPDLPRQINVVTRALQLFAPDRLDDDHWAQRYLDMALDTTTPDLDPDLRRGLLGQQAATTAYDDRLDAL